MPDRVYRLRKIIASQKGLAIGLIVVVCVILGVLIYRERAALMEFRWQIQPVYLVPVVCFRILSIFVQVLSWHLMLKRINRASSLRMDTKVYLASVVSRRIPGAIWQIGSRFALYPPEVVSTSSLVIATSLEFVVLSIAGLLLYFLFMPFYTFIQNWPWQIFLGIGIALLVVLLVKTDLVVRISNFFLRKYHKPQLSVTILRSDMIIWLGLLSLAWFCDGASLFFWITAMTDPVPFFDVLGISTLSLLVSVAAQILPTGFVLREMTASSLLSNWIPISVGIILTLGYRVGMILVEIILSVLVYTALHSPGGKKPSA